MNKLSNHIKLLATIFSFFLFVVSCDQDPLEDVNLIVDLEFSETIYAFSFVDAVTGEPIGMEPGEPQVRVTVTGTNAGEVIDIGGPDGPDFKAANGFLTLTPRPGTTISQSDPLEFNVVVHAEGYFSTSIPVASAEERAETFVIPLVNIANPPEGVDVVVDETGSLTTDGVVKETVEIQTEQAGTGGAANVIIPKDMTILDAEGNPLRGALTATVGYFSHMDESSLETFPGGLIASVNDNGTQEDVAFFSAGFVAIEIVDARGKKAKTFQNGTVALKVEMPAETYNPNTDANVQDGDIIPLWSYDEETGEWFSEGEAAITGPNVNGMYEVVGQLEHLSYWNWDWKWGGPVCFWGANLCFASNVLPNGAPVLGVLSAYTLQGRLLKRAYVFMRIGDCFQFIRVPANLPVNLVLRGFDGQILGSTQINNLCAGTHTLNVGGGAGGAQFFDLTVRVSGFCLSQPNTLLRPSLGFWYKNISRPSRWHFSRMRNGRAVIPNVRLGDTYIAGVYFDGVWVSEIRTITSDADIVLDNVQFTNRMCSFLGF